MVRSAVSSLLCLTLMISGGPPATLFAQDSLGKIKIPRKQSQPPGPPLSPEEALGKMTVPPGFRVELVACEPDLVNPVAMAFDERGRIWVTESFEYPRREAGPGRDRIKILEDTDGDGKVDSVKVFAEGLNIPSGIAVGHGGVWVANAPDILFLQDTDGDDRADKTEVVVTGFGRQDTHELPNSLTWGPDGYLYGLNGVFNPCRVESDGQVFEFTCALFRIDPFTRKFELFCEGTSNPWGIAWNSEGQPFISACVIDHLWHLTETGYYLRQGGAYPPHATKIGSIVDYKHQMAAYCGITYFDSPAYPAEYRDKLMMGNIHGNCINVDGLERNGATYRGVKHDDFLSGNDVWFMPVVQKVGPDGCLYVLDWYDRYHCYQDANADPEGIDRGHGRLYRVVHEATGRPQPLLQHKATAKMLVGQLSDANAVIRETAQRLLGEQRCEGVVEDLEQLAADADLPLKQRLPALWSLASGRVVSAALLQRLLQDPQPAVRAWAVRLAGDQRADQAELAQVIAKLAQDAHPEVQLQVAIAAGKFSALSDPLPIWLDVLEHCGQDALIPQIVWMNLHPLLPERSADLLQRVETMDIAASPAVAAILPRVAEKLQD